MKYNIYILHNLTPGWQLEVGYGHLDGPGHERRCPLSLQCLRLSRMVLEVRAQSIHTQLGSSRHVHMQSWSHHH